MKRQKLALLLSVALILCLCAVALGQRIRKHGGLIDISPTGAVTITPATGQAVAIVGTTAITGNQTVSGTLAATGNFAVNTDKFTVAASSGNTTVGGTFVSTGTMNGPFGATRVVGSTQAITAAMSGRLFAVNNATDAATVLTLPAASTAGLRYCFAADAVTGSNREVDVETPAGSDLIVGTTTAAGGTGIATTAGASHGIKNTHATAVRGNSVCIQSDGVNTWYMTSVTGTWAAY